MAWHLVGLHSAVAWIFVDTDQKGVVSELLIMEMQFRYTKAYFTRYKDFSLEMVVQLLNSSSSNPLIYRRLSYPSNACLPIECLLIHQILAYSLNSGLFSKCLLIYQMPHQMLAYSSKLYFPTKGLLIHINNVYS